MTLPRIVTVLLFAAALPAFAQSVDLSISIEAATEGPKPADRVAVGQTVYYVISYDGIEPVVASGVILEFDAAGVVTQVLDQYGLSCTKDDPIRCTFGDRSAASGFLQIAVRIDTPGMKTTVARLTNLGPTPDSNPANNTATHTLTAVALPSLELSADVFIEPLEPGQRARFPLSVENHAGTPATDVVLTVTLPSGGTIVAGGTTTHNASCALTDNALVCTARSLAQDHGLSAEVAFTAPPRTTGEDLVIHGAVTSAEEDLDPTDNQLTRVVTMVRQFVVSNVEDEGSGSLRQAIHDVNALCPIRRPCAILFHIFGPVPGNGWFTIQPRTPLPEIVATVKIDGRTQTAFTGDTNADGPEIEINGALVYEQSGLRLRPSCDVEIRNLAVNGFPGYGIEIRRQFEGSDADPCYSNHSLRLAAYVRENYLGTDPRGRIAKPNQRGLGIFTAYSFVSDNLISGNLRSGIYAADSHYVDIRRNRVGIGMDGLPLGNGAGIFLDVGDSLFNSSGGADVVENVIAHNNGMAVARTRRGEISVTTNSMFDNLLQGIDIDVDGPTPNREDDLDVPNHPVLFSAAYDPSQNATIIRGRLDSNAGLPSFPTFVIDVYASSRRSVWGYPQAERLLVREVMQSGHQDFEIVVPLDLRGQWITAASRVSHYVGFIRNPRRLGAQSHDSAFPADTSEMSNAVPVR